MEAVKIKGVGKKGLVFIVDLSCPLSKIKDEAAKRLNETREFFQKNPLFLSFIETEEVEEDFFKKKEVQKLIVNEGFLIDCNSTVVENIVTKEVNKTMIIRKQLRARNKYYFDGDIVLFGDVNAEAKVEITGSFICLGEIRGIVHAGQRNPSTKNFDYSREVCVYGRRINSSQIKLRDTVYENVNKKDYLIVVE